MFADLQLSLRSSGTIFTDPQGKLAHRSLQILKDSATWVFLSPSFYLIFARSYTSKNRLPTKSCKNMERFTILRVILAQGPC